RSGQKIELRFGQRHRAPLRAQRETHARVETERPAPDAVQRRQPDLAVALVAFRVLAVDEVAEKGDAIEPAAQRDERFDLAFRFGEPLGPVEDAERTVDAVPLLAQELAPPADGGTRLPALGRVFGAAADRERAPDAHLGGRASDRR